MHKLVRKLHYHHLRISNREIYFSFFFLFDLCNLILVLHNFGFYNSVHVIISSVVPNSLTINFKWKGMSSLMKVIDSMCFIIPSAPNKATNETYPKIFFVFTYHTFENLCLRIHMVFKIILFFTYQALLSQKWPKNFFQCFLRNILDIFIFNFDMLAFLGILTISFKKHTKL